MAKRAFEQHTNCNHYQESEPAHKRLKTSQSTWISNNNTSNTQSMPIPNSNSNSNNFVFPTNGTFICLGNNCIDLRLTNGFWIGFTNLSIKEINRLILDYYLKTKDCNIVKEYFIALINEMYQIAKFHSNRFIKCGKQFTRDFHLPLNFCLKYNLSSTLLQKVNLDIILKPSQSQSQSQSQLQSQNYDVWYKRENIQGINDCTMVNENDVQQLCNGFAKVFEGIRNPDDSIALFRHRKWDWGRYGQKKSLNALILHSVGHKMCKKASIDSVNSDSSDGNISTNGISNNDHLTTEENGKDSIRNMTAMLDTQAIEGKSYSNWDWDENSIKNENNDYNDQTAEFVHKFKDPKNGFVQVGKNTFIKLNNWYNGNNININESESSDSGINGGNVNESLQMQNDYSVKISGKNNIDQSDDVDFDVESKLKFKFVNINEFESQQKLLINTDINVETTSSNNINSFEIDHRNTTQRIANNKMSTTADYNHRENLGTSHTKTEKKLIAKQDPKGLLPAADDITVVSQSVSKCHQANVNVCHGDSGTYNGTGSQINDTYDIHQQLNNFSFDLCQNGDKKTFYFIPKCQMCVDGDDNRDFSEEPNTSSDEENNFCGYIDLNGGNIFCWGRYETTKIANVIQKNVECLSQNKTICSFIGDYCSGGCKMANARLLLNAYVAQVARGQV